MTEEADEPLATAADRKKRKNEASEGNFVAVAPDGDVVIQVLGVGYRMSSQKLRGASEYFNSLLHPEKFKEGAEVAQRLEKLKLSGTEISEGDLPVVEIEGVEDRSLVEYFLQLVEGSGTLPERERKLTTDFVYRLAIYADSFLAQEIVQGVVDKLFKDSPAACPTASNGRALEPWPTEVKEPLWRKRICLGLWFDLPDWVCYYSAYLVECGSSYWTVDDDDENASELYEPWMYLPSGAEQELRSRRRSILSRMDSLVAYFLHKYASSEQQCRLGYDTSFQCDQFQFSQMTRFFLRKGLLAQQGLIAQGHRPASPGYQGTLRTLISTIKEIPYDQVDQNHRHCGPKELLRDRVLFLEDVLMYTPTAIGLCLHCWKSDPGYELWSSVKLSCYCYSHAWGSNTMDSTAPKPPHDKDLHQRAKRLFGSAEIDWSGRRGWRFSNRDIAWRGHGVVAFAV